MTSSPHGSVIAHYFILCNRHIRTSPHSPVVVPFGPFRKSPRADVPLPVLLLELHFSFTSLGVNIHKRTAGFSTTKIFMVKVSVIRLCSEHFSDSHVGDMSSRFPY